MVIGFFLRRSMTLGKGDAPMIPESSPLQRFLKEVIERNYDDVGVRNSEIQDYVANVMAEFCEAESLYKSKMRMDVRYAMSARCCWSPIRFTVQRLRLTASAKVRKHIGDYTLFFTGMFPESLNRYRMRKARMEGLVDFVKAGERELLHRLQVRTL